MSPYRIITRWITPSEVRPIADQLFRQAEAMRAIARRVRASGAALDGTWTGGARQAFFAEFEALPKDLEHFASGLEAKAVAVSAVSVIEQIREWVDETFKH